MNPAFAVNTGGEPLILAHRGAAISHPENTMLAFRKSLQAGADGIEFDVRITADGHPVVVHDSNLKRISGKNLDTGALLLEELQSITLPFNQRIPTLAELLKTFGNCCHLLVEIKELQAAVPAIQTVQRSRAGSISYCSFDPAVVQICRQLHPGVPAFLNTGALAPSPKGLWREHFPERTAAQCGASGISCYHRFLNHRQVRAAESTGGPLMTWCGLFDEKTDAEWIHRVYDYSPGVYITARPAEARRLLESIRLSRNSAATAEPMRKTAGM
jgi:glycerophosphoryl diester phosphodiesterase